MINPDSQATQGASVQEFYSQFLTDATLTYQGKPAQWDGQALQCDGAAIAARDIRLADLTVNGVPGHQDPALANA